MHFEIRVERPGLLYQYLRIVERPGRSEAVAVLGQLDLLPCWRESSCRRVDGVHRIAQFFLCVLHVVGFRTVVVAEAP